MDRAGRGRRVHEPRRSDARARAAAGRCEGLAGPAARSSREGAARVESVDAALARRHTAPRRIRDAVQGAAGEPARADAGVRTVGDRHPRQRVLRLRDVGRVPRARDERALSHQASGQPGDDRRHERVRRTPARAVRSRRVGRTAPGRTRRAARARRDRARRGSGVSRGIEGRPRARRARVAGSAVERRAADHQRRDALPSRARRARGARHDRPQPRSPSTASTTSTTRS